MYSTNVAHSVLGYVLIKKIKIIQIILYYG